LNPTWQLPRDVVLFLLVMELLASYDGRGRPERALGRPRDAPPPRGKLRPSRGALCGRRPRG
jgi:hypothetical protein